jgi:hypothetical protein
MVTPGRERLSRGVLRDSGAVEKTKRGGFHAAQICESLSGMWPFEQNRQQILERPEPPVDRGAETLATVRKLKAELDAVDRDMLAFKTKYKIKTNRFGVLLSVESPTMNGYAPIRCEWDALLRRRDNAVARWHQALHEWSEAKEAIK